jgi:hypothetical protein
MTHTVSVKRLGAKAPGAKPKKYASIALRIPFIREDSTRFSLKQLSILYKASAIGIWKALRKVTKTGLLGSPSQRRCLAKEAWEGADNGPGRFVTRLVELRALEGKTPGDIVKELQALGYAFVTTKSIKSLTKG